MRRRKSKMGVRKEMGIRKGGRREQVERGKKRRRPESED